MSNRTVAEIIGWELLDDLQPVDIWGNPAIHDGCCTARWRAPDGEVYDESCAPPEPTVDDMLAWLRDEGWLASAASSTPWRDDPGGIRLSVWNTKHEVPAITAPTLHAALSAAVLAVAEREEPGNE